MVFASVPTNATPGTAPIGPKTLPVSGGVDHWIRPVAGSSEKILEALVGELVFGSPRLDDMTSRRSTGGAEPITPPNTLPGVRRVCQTTAPVVRSRAWYVP